MLFIQCSYFRLSGVIRQAPFQRPDKRFAGLDKRKSRNGLMPFLLFGPSVEIRTRGLLNPIQARYQTSPHPDICLLRSALEYISIPCRKKQALFSQISKFFYGGNFAPVCAYSPRSPWITLPIFQRVTTCCSATCFSSSFSYST